MKSMKLFVQGEGLSQIEVIEAGNGDTIQAVVDRAREKGLVFDCDSHVLLEDGDDELSLDADVGAVGLSNRCHIHVHRCRRVDVTVNYNGEQIRREFPPSTKVKRVMKWATGHQGFDIPESDATELGLKVCNASEFLDEDVHIGTLVQYPQCEVCFDLAPRQRVEG